MAKKVWKRSCTSYGLFKKWSTFLVSKILTKIWEIKTILIYLINWNLYILHNPHQVWRFKNGRQYFENLKIRCFRYQMFKLEYCKNCVDEKMSFNSHVFWDTLYYDRKCLNSSPQGYLWSVVLSFAIFKISN